MFRCPVCHTEHQFLRDILACHPAELRAVIDTITTDNLGQTLTPILTGNVPGWLLRRALDRLHGTTSEEHADAAA